MGMYTEILIRVDLKSDLPQDVKDVLEFLFGNSQNEPSSLPEHEFFQCDRWQCIGTMSSYYHVPWATSRYHEGYIFSRSDLKNYGGEIEKFFDWFKPYVEAGNDGKCIGWSWYEEALTPTLVIA